MMSRSELGKNQQRLVLLSFALICPISALLVLWGFDFVVHANGVFIGSALAFSAGCIFLCISLGDLLQEVHFHSHDRLSMTLLLFLGIGFSLVLINFEPDHIYFIANQAHIHHHVEQE